MTLRGFWLLISGAPREILPSIAVAAAPAAEFWIRRVLEIREGATQARLRIRNLIVTVRLISRQEFYDILIPIRLVFWKSNYYYGYEG
jgi:hypothetical protein